ncbi:MAG: hypothetical protein IKJ85_01745 [Firmicutes bacterium]|nr:hypothetical protein [Bacillota bacterium]
MIIKIILVISCIVFFGCILRSYHENKALTIKILAFISLVYVISSAFSVILITTGIADHFYRTSEPQNYVSVLEKINDSNMSTEEMTDINEIDISNLDNYIIDDNMKKFDCFVPSDIVEAFESFIDVESEYQTFLKE